MLCRNRNIFILLLVLVVFATSVQGQDSSSTNFGKNIYRKSWSLGFKVHTSGIGGEFRQEKFVTATQKNFWNIDVSNIKHIKEQKSFNQGQEESNIVYGKLNSFYQIRAGVGQQKVQFKKLVIRGVQISSIVNVALTAGWLKPVFVEVGTTISKGDVVCVIEAMKLFNEIESEISGTIVKVLVEDASPVEFDQPLFLVEPNK